MAFFSGNVTLRGRSWFDTHTSEASISPGVKLGSGMVQKPVDGSSSAFEQCCAEAKPASRNSKRQLKTASTRDRIISPITALFGKGSCTPREGAEKQRNYRSEERRVGKECRS